MGTTQRIAARLAVTVVAGAALVGISTGTASAAPVDMVVNTSCSWPQVVSATYAVSPEEGNALANSAMSGQFAQFLALPSTQRRIALGYMPGAGDRINQVFGGPGGGIAYEVFRTCSSF